jgi:hypothetical protein
MQLLLRGVVVGAIIGGLLYGFLIVWLHAVEWLAAPAALTLGFAILAMVGTRRNDREPPRTPHGVPQRRTCRRFRIGRFWTGLRSAGWGAPQRLPPERTPGEAE